MFGLLGDIFGRKKSYAQEPPTDHKDTKLDSSVLMQIDDLFFIDGQGVVVIGRINAGSVSVGDMVRIKNSNLSSIQVSKIEAFNKQLNDAHEGMNVGIYFSKLQQSDIDKNIASGMYITR